MPITGIKNISKTLVNEISIYSSANWLWWIDYIGKILKPHHVKQLTLQKLGLFLEELRSASKVVHLTT
jgi:hypothetical protein